MFDDNMRYLPKNFEFFCKVHSCTEDSEMFDLGVRRGDLILCKMLSYETKDPDVLFKLASGDFITSHRKQNHGVWIAYEGGVTGGGFIDKKSRDEALSILGLTHWGIEREKEKDETGST